MPNRTRSGAPCSSHHILCHTVRQILAVACAIAVFRAPTSAAQSPRVTARGGPAPVAVITLDPYPSTTRSFSVRARVGGQEGVFLWDTGEGISMITPAFARRVGCTPWGQITGYRMTGDRIDAPHCDALAFDVSGIRLTAPSVIVYDISEFTKPGTPVLDGSLGLDLFAGRALTFQLVRGTLTVESPASLAARVATSRGTATRGVEVPVRVVRDAEGLALTVNLAVPTSAGTAWMELDSGNSGPSMFVARYLAGVFRLDTMQTVPQLVRLTVGGRTARSVPLETVARTLPRMAMDGNLGVTFLQQYDVTLDLAAGRAWLAPAAQR